MYVHVEDGLSKDYRAAEMDEDSVICWLQLLTQRVKE